MTKQETLHGLSPNEPILYFHLDHHHPHCWPSAAVGLCPTYLLRQYSFPELVHTVWNEVPQPPLSTVKGYSGWNLHA